MSQNCAVAPSNKKEYITGIGKILVKENGKKKYYKPKEVKKAHSTSDWVDVVDISCWAMSVFTSHSDFDKHHLETGEVCSYVDMKSEMMSGLASSSSSTWAEIPDLNIDNSWLDFGDFFDGIGVFFGAILDV